MKPSFKPILAATLMPSDAECNDTTVMLAMKALRYPVMATVKLDGIRALRMEMPILASRTLKWIPNEELCARALSLPIGYDMELWSPDLSYNEIQSIVMSEKSNAEKIEFYVLDDFTLDGNYLQRVQAIVKYRYEHQDLTKCSCFSGDAFSGIKQCRSADELFAFEQYCIQQHSEGICFRTPDSPYKQGRSTLFEQYLVKHCRYIYEDCTIIGFTEQKENTNKEKRNAVGKMDRSKSISGMLSKETLGTFTVRNQHGIRFDVGTGEGLTNTLRSEIWQTKECYLGRTIIVKSKAHGAKNKPRSPIFWGFREKGY